MTNNAVKLKWEDFKKAYEYFEKHCKDGFIKIDVQAAKVHFHATDKFREAHEVIIHDEKYHYKPKLVKREEL